MCCPALYLYCVCVVTVKCHTSNSICIDNNATPCLSVVTSLDGMCQCQGQPLNFQTMKYINVMCLHLCCVVHCTTLMCFPHKTTVQYQHEQYLIDGSMNLIGGFQWKILFSDDLKCAPPLFSVLSSKQTLLLTEIN